MNVEAVDFKDVLARYPMLDFLSVSYWDKSSQRKAAKAVVDYTNTVDAMEVVEDAEKKIEVA